MKGTTTASDEIKKSAAQRSPGIDSLDRLVRAKKRVFPESALDILHCGTTFPKGVSKMFFRLSIAQFLVVVLTAAFAVSAGHASFWPRACCDDCWECVAGSSSSCPACTRNVPSSGSSETGCDLLPQCRAGADRYPASLVVVRPSYSEQIVLSKILDRKQAKTIGTPAPEDMSVPRGFGCTLIIVNCALLI